MNHDESVDIKLFVQFPDRHVRDGSSWIPGPIRMALETILSKGANFEHQKTLQIGEKLFDQQIKLENTSFLLNATVNIFDYFGGVLPYFCLAPLVFGGIYDHLEPSELSALISEVSFKIPCSETISFLRIHLLLFTWYINSQNYLIKFGVSEMY